MLFRDANPPSHPPQILHHILRRQPTETVAYPTTPSNRTRTRTRTTTPPPTVHQQFAQLAEVHSQLQGLCRSFAYNSTPIPVPHIARDSEVWKAFRDSPEANLRTTFTVTPFSTYLYKTFLIPINTRLNNIN